MSQLKNTKVSLNATEENGTEFKAPTETSSEALHMNDTNKDDVVIINSDFPKDKIRTRSRSKTPLLGNTSEITKNAESKPDIPESPPHNHHTRSHSKTARNKTSPDEVSKILPEVIPDEAEPVFNEELDLSTVSVDQISSIETDSSVLDKDEEVVPELEFDDNDIDVESEGSPNRCKARRSQAASVSTPKTPKLVEDEEFLIVGANESFDNDVSDTHSSISTGDISTTAVVGSDITGNYDFIQDSISLDENTYTSPDRSKSFRETLKNISPRRTIRSVNADNYRKFALENDRLKGYELTTAIPSYDLVERVAGVKRKSSSIQLSEPKKFKGSPGLLSYITFPIHTLKNVIGTTKKLNKMDYEEKETNSDRESIKISDGQVGRGEHKWCSIM